MFLSYTGICAIPGAAICAAISLATGGTALVRRRRGKPFGRLAIVAEKAALCQATFLAFVAAFLLTLAQGLHAEFPFFYIYCALLASPSAVGAVFLFRRFRENTLVVVVLSGLVVLIFGVPLLVGILQAYLD